MIEIDVTEMGTIEQVVDLWQKSLPSLDTEAFEIHLKLYQVNLIADRLYNDIADDFSLSDVDVSILMLVSRNQRGRPVRPTDLGRSLRIKASAITYRLDQLQELGFIERTLDGNDRRAVGVKVTEVGLTVVNEIVLRFNRKTAERLAAVVGDGGNIADLRQHLDRLVKAWTSPDAALK
ncbi:MarR family winged helix-turn-helix transcriptional regulator [Sphingobium nicotianae]|uniref:MarR family transcriptional regulator n=1 Tax=Sphingobium nicotianae TaxID=2782607 RepID=A0A9X1DAU8_9SPHN|nr:MarR family transcriptional regulator [Sphingobium nicotianae]MBT2186544.1 MarR family transcriptional regulator [Sphingobium nicotianae]